MGRESFDNLMLIGRAGCGKSELIEFLNSTPEDQRLEKYHIGKFERLDDFPWLYSMFQDEDLWEELGYPRRISKKTGCIYDTVDYKLYDFLDLKFNFEIKKRYPQGSEFYKEKTLFVEYARGRENAYKNAISKFDAEILKRTAIFYMDNTFEESMRRNEVRSSEKDAKQTILYHKTPVPVMEYYYKNHDWYELTNKKPEGYVEINGVKVPFVTVWNVPESHDLAELAARYNPPLTKLWELYKARR